MAAAPRAPFWPAAGKGSTRGPDCSASIRRRIRSRCRPGDRSEHTASAPATAAFAGVVEGRFSAACVTGFARRAMREVAQRRLVVRIEDASPRSARYRRMRRLSSRCRLAANTAGLQDAAQLPQRPKQVNPDGRFRQSRHLAHLARRLPLDVAEQEDVPLPPGKLCQSRSSTPAAVRSRAAVLRARARGRRQVDRRAGLVARGRTRPSPTVPGAASPSAGRGRCSRGCA